MMWGEKPAHSLAWRTAFLLLVLSVFGFSTQSRLHLPQYSSTKRTVQHARTSAAASHRLKAEEPLDDCWEPCVFPMIQPVVLRRPSRPPQIEPVVYAGTVFLATRAVRPPPAF